MSRDSLPHDCGSIAMPQGVLVIRPLVCARCGREAIGLHICGSNERRPVKTKTETQFMRCDDYIEITLNRRRKRLVIKTTADALRTLAIALEEAAEHGSCGDERGGFWFERVD